MLPNHQYKELSAAPTLGKRGSTVWQISEENQLRHQLSRKSSHAWKNSQFQNLLARNSLAWFAIFSFSPLSSLRQRMDKASVKGPIFQRCHIIHISCSKRKQLLPQKMGSVSLDWGVVHSSRYERFRVQLRRTGGTAVAAGQVFAACGERAVGMWFVYFFYLFVL